MIKRCVICDKEFEPKYYKTKTCSKECKIQLMFQTNEKKYGSKCSLQNPEVLAKAEATNEKLYGFKNPSQSPEIKAKVVATNIKNYGVTNVFKNPKIKARVEATNEERYGHKNPIYNDEIKAKIKKTNEERYEGGHSSRDPRIRAKMAKTVAERYSDPEMLKQFNERFQQTCLDRYGVKHPMGNAEIKAKREQTNLVNYGVSYPAKLPEIQAKIQATCKEKHGVRNFSHRNITNYEDYNREFILLNFADDNGVIRAVDRKRFCDYFNLSYKGVTSRFKQFNIKYETMDVFSFKEKEIADYIKTFYEFDILENSREFIVNPETNFHLEIDIVVISNGEVLCGIEYNGIYWHDKKKPVKEVTKSNLCAAQGFPLFHIWEDNIEEDFLRVLDFLEKYKNKDS